MEDLRDIERWVREQRVFPSSRKRQIIARRYADEDRWYFYGVIKLTTGGASGEALFPIIIPPDQEPPIDLDMEDQLDDGLNTAITLFDASAAEHGPGLKGKFDGAVSSRKIAVPGSGPYKIRKGRI
jgi:hypothetical protein